MMYASQIIMLHTLNLHSARCQLYLNKTGGKTNSPHPQIECISCRQKKKKKGKHPWVYCV